MLGKASQRRVFSSRLNYRGLPMAPSLQPFLGAPRALSYLHPNAPPHCGHPTASSPRLGCSLCPANKDGKRRQQASHLDHCAAPMPGMHREARRAAPEHT